MSVRRVTVRRRVVAIDDNLPSAGIFDRHRARFILCIVCLIAASFLIECARSCGQPVYQHCADQTLPTRIRMRDFGLRDDSWP